MSRCTLRNIFTVLVYAGVALFLYPYLTGHFSDAVLFLVAGIVLAVICGILRAACMEGDCSEREIVDGIASEPSQKQVPNHPPSVAHR